MTCHVTCCIMYEYLVLCHVITGGLCMSCHVTCHVAHVLELCGGVCSSCILGELFLRKPLFQGNQEFMQLEIIRLAGAISLYAFCYI